MVACGLRKQPIIVPCFESENALKFYNLEARITWLLIFDIIRLLDEKKRMPYCCIVLYESLIEIMFLIACEQQRHSSACTSAQSDHCHCCSLVVSKFTFEFLTLNAPIATKVICFSRLLKCLRSLYGKQCRPRSDCSYRSSLFWVHAVCFYP